MYENELIHNFQKDCLLLFNMQSSTKNIMNKNQKYIHFYSDNAPTFILDDDFNLTQKETNIVLIYDNPMYHLESNWDKIILNHKIPFKKPNPNDDIYKHREYYYHKVSQRYY